MAREFLAALGVEVMSYVVSVGDAAMPEETMADAAEHKPLDIELSEMRCPDAKATIAMKKAIDRAKSDGESLGGTFRIVVCGLRRGSAPTPRAPIASPRGWARRSFPSPPSRAWNSASVFRQPRVLGRRCTTPSCSPTASSAARRTTPAA